METQNIFVFLAASMLCMCFGWGVRGSAIGGEKGAMLPGALLGVICTWYTGSDLLMQNVFLFSAAGALGYFYGGMETYGSTMGLVLNHGTSWHNPSLGYLALAFKGSIWGCLGAGFLGISFSAVSGAVYKWYDFVIFFALVPFIQQIGYRIFNTPYDPENGKMPKVCFSDKRREEWGRNLAVIAALLVLMVYRKDIFGILMCAAGALAGSSGWVVGISIFDKQLRSAQKGKHMFGALSKYNVLDGWKIMEFVQGCFNGLVIGGAFALGWPLAAENLAEAEASGKLWCGIPSMVEAVLPWVFCALIICIAFLFTSKKFSKADENILDVIERPFYMVAPLCLIMLGSITMAQLICGFAMYFVVAFHDAKERFNKYKHIKLIRAVLILIGAAILTVHAVRGFNLIEIWAFCCFGYLVFDFAAIFHPATVKENRQKSKNTKEFIASFGGSATVQPFFWLSATVIFVFGLVNF